MLSQTTRRNLFGKLANNETTATLSLADTLMNNIEKQVTSFRTWPFLEKQYTVLTSSSLQFVQLAHYTDKVLSVYVTVGTKRHTPKECPSRVMWDRLNEIVPVGDTPEWWFVYDGKIGLYPRPSTASNVITLNVRRTAKDLSVADYTTGTITTATNASGAIVGSGTTWTAKMIGRYLRITDGDSITTSGDGEWYEISAVGSTTTLTLLRVYAGASISGGTATYTIAQCSLLPEAYQMLPIYGALKIYFTSSDPNPAKAKMYDNEFTTLLRQMGTDALNKTEGVIVDDDEISAILNPNLYVTY